MALYFTRLLHFKNTTGIILFFHQQKMLLNLQPQRSALGAPNFAASSKTLGLYGSHQRLEVIVESAGLTC